MQATIIQQVGQPHLGIIIKMQGISFCIKFEPNAMGIYGGKITNIAWQTLYSNSSTSTFYDYTIKMGCTQLNSLSSSWETDYSLFINQTFVVNLG